MENKILIVGSGFMAKEYLLVLHAMRKKAIIVGRGQENIQKLKNEFPEFEYHDGGIDKYIESGNDIPFFAINASSINQLNRTTKILLLAGVKNILLEKPGDLFLKGLEEIETLTQNLGANVFIAYNRRFYNSVQTLKKLVIEDGGILSAHFEFTEWVHTIDQSKFEKDVLNKWIISNSAHVIDTFFFIIGQPVNMYNMVCGEEVIPWHPSGSVFIGMGKSTQNIPFSYHSNWSSAGRWGIEISTSKRRFYLKPMEKLAQQKLGSITLEEIEIDEVLDLKYKPGLYVQVNNFLIGEFDSMCTIEEQRKNYQNIYMKIASYKN